jgi:hypothetical protein
MKIANGLYGIKIFSGSRDTNPAGGAVVAIRDGSLNGGDSSCGYQGKIEPRGAGDNGTLQVQGTITMQHWNNAVAPVIPGATLCKIEISGKYDPKNCSMILEGRATNPYASLRVEATRIGNLVE